METARRARREAGESETGFSEGAARVKAYWAALQGPSAESKLCQGGWGATASWSERAETGSTGAREAKEVSWISCQSQGEATEGFQAEERHTD